MNFYQKGRQVIDLFAFFFEKNFLNNTLTSEGIVKGNDPYLYGEKVKAYLRRGAKPLPGFMQYPNPLVGYGVLCLKDSLPR